MDLTQIDKVVDITYKLTGIALNFVVLFIVNSDNLRKFFVNTFKRLWK